MGMGRALALAAALLLCGGTAGFDAHKMKKCADNAFCKRHRGYADAPGASPEARGGAYVATAASLELDGAGARLLVESARHKVPLELTISALPGGMTARVRLREAEPLHPRFEAPYVLVESGTTTAPLALLVKDTDGVTFALGGKDVGQVRVDFSPLRVRFFAPAVSPGTEPVEVVTLNARGLLEYEHYRKRPPPTAAAAEKVDEEGTEEGGEQAKPEGEADTDEELVWEESFQSHKDTRPRGPSSIGLDLELPGFSHVFGLPERATSFNLKNTR
ncbi:hypothetical protein T492DRAFT_868896 [Pavlovales sp. CCMP2436]|nr:hypothetical protein T492DRAFT_868896 [Pavlovales sp. CCMP2436]